MDSTLTQKNLQRAQPNENVNGPRVSFNKDVHVKRIGNRPNEINSSYTLNGNTSPPQPPYTRQLPQDLTEEALLKEAEKVIAQTGRIKCTVDTPNSLAGIRLQDKSAEDQKFNSLPHRRDKPSKPLDRSISDASQKKPKRASIFSLFSKRSDPNINSTTTATGNDIQLSGGGGVESTTNNQKRARKTVGRSKSDVGYNSSDSSGGRGRNHSTLDRKRIKIPDSDESMTKVKKKSQLSPISENPPTVDKHFGYFPARNDKERNIDDNNKQRNYLRNAKSEEKTAPSTLRSSLTKSNKLRFDDENSGSPSRRSNIQSQSLENLHSSQLPQEKLPLTKGVRVDGIVKRLSMDRFSPPLTFNAPAFSYTRPPNESIVYAQVLRDENGEKTKPSMNNGLNGHEQSPLYRDQVDSTMPGARSRTLFDHHMRPHEMQSPQQQQQQQQLQQHFIDDRHHAMHMNSDEDEGLGFEEKKYSPRRDTSRQSSSEPPIIPTLHPSYGSIEHLANRRKLLESKIHERAFDFGRDRNGNGVGGKKTHIVPIKHETIIDDDREFNNNKFNHRVNHHQSQTTEQPKKTLFTPTPHKQWIKQPKYYPETNLDDEFLSDMDSIRREQERQRHKDYMDKTFERLSPGKCVPGGHNGRVIDLGYIDQYDDSNQLNNNNSNVINHNLGHKYRMKPSADPKTEVEWVTNSNNHNTHQQHLMARIDNDHRRKLDKVDSGIENDFKQRDRSESRSNSRTRRTHLPTEDMKNITELFLKRECQFSESLHPSKRRFDFVFRERSIDDGSHFDPRLDKYPENQQKSRSLSRTSPQSGDEKKSDKKFNSLKKIFSIGSKKKHSPEPVIKDPNPETAETINIATRRRLSTPKASPVPKRIPSQKSSKISHVSSHRSSDVSAPPAPKTSWFKSLERLSRKKSKAPDDKKSNISTVKRSNTSANRPTYQRAQSPSPDPKPRSALVQQNLRFFGDTDLESLSKASTNIGRKRTVLIPNSAHSMQNLRLNRPSQPRTVTDSNTHSRHHVRSATSMQNLNSDFRAKYLPDLSESTSENENTVRNNTINCRESDQHQIHHSTPNSKYQKHQRRQYHSMEYLENDEKPEPIRSENDSNRSHNTLGGRGREPKHNSPHRSALRERNGRSSSENCHLPPIGPTKPAREFDRRRALSNDRFLDSSGTEGESSQQSVVYLHATTVGHIPQPYVASSRRSSKSRDELSSIKTKSSSPPQPMTRTVSRSVSMLAPWTPRHISDGYEINYSQTMQNPKKKTSNLKKDNLRKARSRDDVSSKRSNSSMTKSSTLPRNNNNNNNRK